MVKKKQINEHIGVGRRKTAVSSVRLRAGSGKIDVNGKKNLKDYFDTEFQISEILAPLKKFSTPESFDIIIRVKGGGIAAQAMATRLGIARALVTKDDTLRKSLKEEGYLTRDPRMKERKKYGHKKARRGFQFSKR